MKNCDWNDSGTRKNAQYNYIHLKAKWTEMCDG